MATHFSVPAWRIPVVREAWLPTVHGVEKESDTAERLNNNNNCISQLRNVPRLLVINTRSFNILMVALLKVI